MSRRRTPSQLFFSLIEYRRNPARPESGSIPLGFLIALVTKEVIAVGLHARISLSEKERAVLDEVGQELLRDPFDFFVKEMKEEWAKSADPTKVLEVLSSTHSWSIFARPPELVRMVLKRGGKQESGGIVRAAMAKGEQIYSRWVREHSPARPKRASAASRKQRVARSALPAWMISSLSEKSYEGSYLMASPE